MVYTDYWKQRPGCRFVGEEGWVYVDRPTIEAEPASLLSVQLKTSDRPLAVSNHHGLESSLSRWCISAGNS